MGPVTFGDLRAHVTRDAVIIVDTSLDLLDVAVCVAKDDKAAASQPVQPQRSLPGWLKSRALLCRNA